MSLFKRVLLGGFPIGLVVAVATAHAPLHVPEGHQTAYKAHHAIPAATGDWDATQIQTAAEEQADRDLAEQVATLAAEQAQALADQLQAAINRSLAAVPAPAVSAPSSGDFATFRACTIQIESHGQYDINSGNGYYGAWQFAQGTWDGAVARAGHPEWSGRPASDAPPAIQDAAAYQLYSERGNAPWGGRC